MVCAKTQFADAWYTPQFNIAMGDGCFNGADLSSSFTIDTIGITCDGACTFNSTARFEGNFTIGDKGVSSNFAYIDANAWGVKMFNDTIDLCSEGNVTSIDGGACPAAGSYSFAFEMALPAKTFSIFLKSTNATATIVELDSDETVMCSFEVKSEYSWTKSNSSSTVVASGVVLLAVFGIKRRHRRVRSLDDEQGTDEEEPISHFEMMFV